jgi:hypothetical protein
VIKTHPEAKKNGTPASPATARASIVLPVPGDLMASVVRYKVYSLQDRKTDPVSRTPLGNLPPRDANAVGSLRNATTS